jgi:hypothetical protein
MSGTMKIAAKAGHSLAREKPAAYGARFAVIETMPADLLDVGVKYMQELKAKALKVSQALQKAKVPHAVIGGLAVAAHVAKVDETAQRNTQDMDVLLRREDLDLAKAALAPIGFRYRHVMKLNAFMPTGRGQKFGDGVHIVWAGEKVREEYLAPAPALSSGNTYRAKDGVEYVGLVDLLLMKLTSYRLKDRVHVQDLLQLKLITKKVEASLPQALRKRLDEVKADTERETL